MIGLRLLDVAGLATIGSAPGLLPSCRGPSSDICSVVMPAYGSGRAEPSNSLIFGRYCGASRGTAEGAVPESPTAAPAISRARWAAAGSVTVVASAAAVAAAAFSTGSRLFNRGGRAGG